LEIRVLIVDDHKIYRESLRRLCEAKGGICIVGEAENGEQAVAMARDLQPDVVLMDVSMPTMDGLEATRRIVEENPESRVIILTMYRGRALLDKVAAAGARGCLHKDASWEDMVESIYVVHSGGSLFQGDSSEYHGL
jgi:DNA-binding NarL/FixJ family response regulator